MAYINHHREELPALVRYADALMRYRHLCLNLVQADLRARFRRSYLGILWAVIQPLGYSLVIAWVWRSLFNESDYWQFALYVFSGMLVWDCFTQTVTGSLDSLMTAAGYLRQSRIPFLIFQLRVPLTSMTIFLAGVVGLVVLMTCLGRVPPLGLHLLLLPFYMVFLAAFLAPIAIIASIFGALLRDLKHITLLVLQALFFLSPVMMSRSFMDSDHLEIVRLLNPLVPLIGMFRGPMILGELWTLSEVLQLTAWCAVLWGLAFVVTTINGRKVIFAI